MARTEKEIIEFSDNVNVCAVVTGGAGVAGFFLAAGPVGIHFSANAAASAYLLYDDKEKIMKKWRSGEYTNDQAYQELDNLVNKNFVLASVSGLGLFDTAFKTAANMAGAGYAIGSGLVDAAETLFNEYVPLVFGSEITEFDQDKFLNEHFSQKEIEAMNPIIADVNASLAQGIYPIATDILQNPKGRELIAIYNQGHPDNQISIIEGNDFGETIYGTAGNDNISGGGGNDTIYGGDGNDTIYGGADDDTIYGDVYHEVVEILHYSDGTTEKRTYIENSLKPGNDKLYGGDGNDKIYGGAGDDIIYGDIGDDYIEGGDGNDKIYGGAGDDDIHGGDGNDKIHGGAGNDEIYGGIGDDYIEGGEGNDKIYGDVGDDIISGDIGDDYIEGGEGNDKIYGGVGNDEIRGNIGDDYIEGGDGNDTIYGGAGNDEIYGGIGDDIIIPGSGNNKVYWNLGDGNDSISFADSTSDSSVKLVLGPDIKKDDLEFEYHQATNAYSLNIVINNTKENIELKNALSRWDLGSINDNFNFEIMLANGETISDVYILNHLKVLGTDGDDHLDLNVSKDILQDDSNYVFNGDAGDDNITTYHGNNTIYGGEGNDEIWAYYDNNTIYGGEGNDYIVSGFYDESSSNYIDGGDGDDEIFVTVGKNVIYGGNGNDRIYVGDLSEGVIFEGECVVSGGAGDDDIQIFSMTGNRTVIWNIGDGMDKVSISDSRNTIIRFGEGINPSDIYLVRANGDDLLLKYKNNSRQGIRLDCYYGDKNWRFDRLEFANGTVIKAANIKTGCYANACTSSTVQPEVPDDGIIRPKKGASKTPGTAGNDEFELDSSVTKPNTVTAGDGDDVINVSSTNGHNIKGEGGNDTITADGSNKLTLDGGEGDDTITLTNSLYGTVKGGAGNDTITVENAQNLATVDLGTGNDKLTLTDSALTTLKLVDGKNTVKAENSTIKTINGGLDDDDIALSDESKSTTIKLNNGTNTLELDNSTVKTITGGVGDDTITLNGSTATTITAGLGDDSITLKAGSTVTTVNLTNGINELNINGATVTTINGGKGTNTINVTSGAVAKLNGGTGADNVTLAVDNTIAKLNAGDDVIAVTGSGVKAYGLAGDDSLAVKGANGCLLDGGVGNDVIVVDGAATATVTGGKGSDSYELKNLQADGVVTINNALKAKGDVDTMSIDRAAGSFTYNVDVKNNLTMTGNDGSVVVINGWKANGMAINFSDGERSVEEVNSFVHKDINVAATKAGAGTAYSDTFIIGAGAKVSSSISGYSKYDTLDLSNYADCDLELTSVKNNLAIKLTRDDKAVGTVTLKNFLTSTSQMTNVVVGDASYKIVQGAEGEWNLSKNMEMLADASLGFADNAAGTSYAEEEHKDAKLLVSGNA